MLLWILRKQLNTMDNKLSYDELLNINQSLLEICNLNNIDVSTIISESQKNNNKGFLNLFLSKIQNSKNVIQLIFDKSPIGIFLFDYQSIVIECNLKFTELVGSEKNKIISFNILESINNIEVKNAIKNCLSNKKTFYTGEYKSVTGNKSSFIKLILNPLTDEENNILGGIGIAEDYTFQKNYENELIQAKAQQRALLDNMPAIAWFKDINGIYLSVNQKFCELSNKKFKDIIGKTDYEIWYKELADKIVNEDLRVITQRRTISNEVKFANNEGEQFELEVYKTPVLDHNSNIIGTTGYATDILTKKKSELELKTEKIYFENLFNNSPEAIVIADINSKVLRINKQFTKMFQFTEDEIIGRNIDEIISDESEIEFAHLITQQIQFGKNSSFETVRLRKDRTKVDVVILGVPITLSDGNVVIYGIYQDISKQKTEQHELLIAKEKAVESDILKTNFLATMSHELRTPLNGILGFSELLLSEDLNDEIMEMAQSIHQSGNRLLETINSILDISIIESNKLNIEIKKENIIDIILGKIKKYSPKALEKNIQINFDFNGVAFLHTDKKIFENIINNLLDNAVKYTKNGNIDIKLSNDYHNDQLYLAICISDTGIGIDKNNYEKIFQYFSQVSEGYTRTYEGSGLGLSITKHYVEILNGIIHLESTLNVGSSFTVKFPIKENDVVFLEKDLYNLSQIKPLILLVEDEKTNAEYVILSIRKLYDIDLATNGMEAIEMASNKQYDLILMDINLGRDMNGIYATSEIRRMINYQDIPIIAVTANAMIGQREELLSKGLTDYISKPFRKDMLIKVIQDNLEII